MSGIISKVCTQPFLGILMENDAFLQFVKKQDWKDFQSVSASGLLRLWTNKIKEEEEIEIKLKKQQSNHPWLNVKNKELQADSNKWIRNVSLENWRKRGKVWCILHDFYISALRFKVSSQLGKNPKHTSKGESKQMSGRLLGLLLLKKLENYS